jgi:hypothetical protein
MPPEVTRRGPLAAGAAPVVAIRALLAEEIFDSDFAETAIPSQVVGHRLRNMPVEPELRFAPRWAWPRIPGRAARAGAAYSGSPFRGCLFDRTMRCGAPVAAGVEGCLHNSHSSPAGLAGC